MSMAALFGGSAPTPVGGIIHLPSATARGLFVAGSQQFLQSGVVTAYSASAHGVLAALAPMFARYGSLVSGSIAETFTSGARVSFASDGTNLAAFWMDGTNLRSAKSTDGGVTFAAPTTIASADQTDFQVFGGTGWMLVAIKSTNAWKVYTSANGTTFTYRTAATGLNADRIAFNGSRWGFVDNSGAVFQYINAVNPDGAWTSGAMTNAPVNGAKLAGGGGAFAAATTNTIKSSSDGLTWTTRTAPTGIGIGNKDYQIAALAHDGTRFVGVCRRNDGGASMAVIRSTDSGVTWTMDSTKFPFALDSTYTSLQAVSGLLVLESAAAAPLYSTDGGVTWNLLRLPVQTLGPQAVPSISLASIWPSGSTFYASVDPADSNIPPISFASFTAAQLAGAPSYVGSPEVLPSFTNGAAFVRIV